MLTISYSMCVSNARRSGLVGKNDHLGPINLRRGVECYESRLLADWFHSCCTMNRMCQLSGADFKSSFLTPLLSLLHWIPCHFDLDSGSNLQQTHRQLSRSTWQHLDCNWLLNAAWTCFQRGWSLNFVDTHRSACNMDRSVKLIKSLSLRQRWCLLYCKIVQRMGRKNKSLINLWNKITIYKTVPLRTEKNVLRLFFFFFLLKFAKKLQEVYSWAELPSCTSSSLSVRFAQNKQSAFDHLFGRILVDIVSTHGNFVIAGIKKGPHSTWTAILKCRVTTSVQHFLNFCHLTFW